MTGIELIAKERQEQLEKHDRTVEYDVKYNKDDELRLAARELLVFVRGTSERNPNKTWDDKAWQKIAEKSAMQRLIIAGALIAAEIDRLNYKE